MTTFETILLAAATEPAGPISAERLIVAAWTRAPKMFGLKGYVELYPDSNKVIACLCGGRSMIAKGLLVKVGPKLYRLTAEGRNAAIALRGDGQAEALPPAVLTGDEIVRLAVLHDSTAAFLFRTGIASQIEEPDARAFFAFAPDVVGQLLKSISGRLGGAVAVLDDGRELGLKDVQKLVETAEYLEVRFARLLVKRRTA